MRERSGDVPLLIDHFIGELARHHGRSIRGISPEARTSALTAIAFINDERSAQAMSNVARTAAEDVPARLSVLIRGWQPPKRRRHAEGIPRRDRALPFRHELRAVGSSP